MGVESRINYEEDRSGGKQVIVLPMHKSEEDQGCKLHWHERIEIYYIHTGGVKVIAAGQHIWLNEGDIGFINWCQPHRGTDFKKNTRYSIIKLRVRDELLEALIKNASSIPCRIHKDEKMQSFLDDIIREEAEKGLGYHWVNESLCNMLVVHILRCYSQIDEKDYRTKDIRMSYIRNILKYISQNYTHTIHLDHLARAQGLSKSHMCRLFKTYTNKTIIGYVNELKCSYAALLIMNGESMSYICEEVGFDDYNYFARVFKKYYGVSPRNFAKREKVLYNH